MNCKNLKHYFTFLCLSLVFAIFNIYSNYGFALIQIRSADYYFDGLNGNDTNDGLTPNTAKKSLDGLKNLGAAMQDKVIALRDSIVYRRTTNGAAAIRVDYNNVTLNNWYEGGSDKLPRILGSNSPITNWSDLGENIWQTNSNIGNNTVYFEFADSARWGILRNSLFELTREFDFYFSADSILYCYSPENPETRYVSIETLNRTFCVNLYGDGGKVEFLQLDYSGFGVAMEPTSDSNIVQYCSINFQGTSTGVLTSCCGEGIQVWSSGNVIRGNLISEATNHGIHIYSYSENISDNLIEYNVVWNCHHTGYDINAVGGSISNVTLRYNTYYDTPWAAERQEPGYQGQSAGFFCNGNVSDITLAYNLFYNIYQSTGIHINLGSNIYVYNNTVANTVDYGTSGYGAILGNSSTVARNNIFVTNGRTTTEGTFLSQSNNLVYNYSGGSTGIISGLNEDPQFVDNLNFNFRLPSESPAVDLGTELGYLSDLDGNSIAGNPDAGAYESLYIGYGNYIIVNEGWNFISIPKLNTNMSADSLLRTRTSPVYEFISDTYRVKDTLKNGIGYVVKFDETQYIHTTGQSVSFPIQVFEGWNLIGPFDEDIPISQLYTSPPNIIISNYFNYNNGQYESSTMLKVGKGYWIRVNQNGWILIQQ